MIHTPDQATQMICPMRRYSDGTLGNCNADGCMMWRWEYKEEMRQEVYTNSDGSKSLVMKRGSASPTHGYCGIAGKPEVTE